MNLGFLNSGYYLLGTKCQKEPVTLGILTINSAVDTQSNPVLGQWCFNFTEDEGTLLKIQDIKTAFLDIACRLGLKPVIFTDKFKKALLEEKTICLVADTSALHHGHLEQALRLRRDKPTHTTIPDQVYMEIQRQRERYKDDKKKEESSCIAQRRLRRLRFAPARAIYRLKQSKIVHYIRPPEAMVRYFGAEISDDNEQRESERINYHRDRLILEALRHQRQILPDVPIWLVTSDANFAIQLELEGFNAGFCRQPEFSKVSSFIITSPFIDPYSFTPYHTSVEDFLEECLWEWGVLTLQREGETKRKILNMLDEKISRNIQLNIESIKQLVTEDKEVKECNIIKKDNTTFLLETVVKVPKRAPSASKMLKFLEILFREKSFVKDTFLGEISYLKALQWIEEIKTTVKLTPRGLKIMENWSSLTLNDVKAWYDWMFDTKKDIKQLDKQTHLINLLSSSTPPPGTDKSLAEKLGGLERDVSSQSALANAFGLAVRLGGKTWKAEEKQPQEAAQLILEKAQSLKNDQVSSAVRVDRIFTALLTTTPLSVPTFRIGLLELFENEKIRLSGTVPDSSGNKSVKVKVLIPQQYEYTIDLGAGDFLVPGQSSQVIVIV